MTATPAPHGGFGELRSLLHGAPSASGWRAICELVQSWPSDDVQGAQQAIHYALDHLRRWPDALRVVPRAWLDAALLGQPPAYLPLATHLDAPYYGLSARDLSVLAASGALDHWRVIRLAHSPLRAEGAWVLASAPCELVGLDLSYCSLGDAGAAQLARARRWDGLRELSLDRNDLGPDGLEALMLASFIPSLESLSLASNWLTDACAAQLSTPRLRSLHTLNLDANRLGDRGVRAMMESRWSAPRLRRLSLAANGLGPDAAQAIAWRAFASPLESLELGRNMIGSRGLHALTESSRLDNLIWLDVSNNALRDEALWAFHDTPHLPQLAGLGLSDNGLTDEGMAAVARWAGLGGLTSLNLSGNLITQRGLARLVSWPGFASLTQLSLANNELDGLDALEQVRAPLALRSLDLSRARLDAAAIRALVAAMAYMPQLERLVLNECGLRPDLLAPLLASPAIAQLTALHITHNALGDAGAALLAYCSGLSGLRTLKLEPNGISRDGYAHLIHSPHLSAALRAQLKQELSIRQERL